MIYGGGVGRTVRERNPGFCRFGLAQSATLPSPIRVGEGAW